MDLIQGPLGEIQPGPYVDCPEEGCVYTLDRGVLSRHKRGADLVIWSESLAIDPEIDGAAHERPRLRRIARMLVESTASARLASPFVIFVPEQGDISAHGIRAGSAIVGAPVPGADRVVVYYEGAVYGQSQMVRFADRVFHAHGRLVERYPTVARMALPRTSLVEVGTFDPPSGTVTPIDGRAEAALAAWLGSEEIDPAELRRSEGPR